MTSRLVDLRADSLASRGDFRTLAGFAREDLLNQIDDVSPRGYSSPVHLESVQSQESRCSVIFSNHDELILSKLPKILPSDGFRFKASWMTARSPHTEQRFISLSSVIVN